ncbi:MAG: lysozyme [Proteobacteria bacterium]|nr:lysozyme [Pseudomonadota bacterium]
MNKLIEWFQSLWPSLFREQAQGDEPLVEAVTGESQQVIQATSLASVAAKGRDLCQAVELIKSFEGIVDGDPSTANFDPYLCPAGYWTIGWGHVVTDPQGKMLKGADNKAAARAVYPKGITRAEAEALLADDVNRFAAGVERLVKVPLCDTRFCALVSFAYNVGLGALETSTLLQLLNKGAMDQVPDQFMRWTKADGKELAGLKRRREAEARLWLSAETVAS